MKKTGRPAPSAALIIAGGRGTRFWPESRAGRPKPLFAIDGKTTLLAATIERLEALIPRERIFVLGSAEHRSALGRALRGTLAPANLIIEPEGRGTAVAITYGAAVIAHRIGDTVPLAVMPADHHITPAEAFRGAIATAIQLAAEHAVVVLGITPARAETGYGYQKIGRAVGAGYKVDRFVEKPTPEIAHRMVKSGNYLWNAGMFVMTAATLLRELDKHAPELAAAMRRFGAIGAKELASVYGSLKFDSFDRVVVERSRSVLSVRANFRWFDVGSWQGLWEAMRAGATSNVVSGNVIAIDTDGVLARGSDRLMVILGVSDLVAIDTGDAILIARRSASQEVRKVTEELARRGMKRYL